MGTVKIEYSSSVAHDIRPQDISIFATSYLTACLALTQTRVSWTNPRIKPGASTAANTIAAKYLTLPGQQEGV